jgi:hypothetical protein
MSLNTSTPRKQPLHGAPSPRGKCLRSAEKWTSVSPWAWGADDVADVAARLAVALGRAMQADPMQPVLKARGTKHLKLKLHTLGSNFAFNFNLRHYSWGSTRT